MFKTLAGVELFLGLQNQKFIKRYESHISGPPIDMIVLSILVLFIWLLRASLLENVTPHLRYALAFLPKYYYELPWLADNHPEQIALYTCLSFFLIVFTVIKTLLFSLYIILTPLGRDISVADRKSVINKIAASLLLFISFIFLLPLPIYGEGASTTLVGNVYFLTFLNIVFLKMLSGGISAAILLCKRIKKRD